MTINELAKKHAITPAAIRHYEKFGLFDHHVLRGHNGYRQFSSDASRRIELIRLGQHVGFSLREMAEKLRHWDDSTMSTEQKKQALTEQLHKIEKKITELHRVQSFIKQEIAKSCD